MTTIPPWAIFKRTVFPILDCEITVDTDPASALGVPVYCLCRAQKAQADTSRSSKGKTLGPGHQEGVSPNQDSSQLWEKCGAEARAQIRGLVQHRLLSAKHNCCSQESMFQFAETVKKPKTNKQKAREGIFASQHA